ncbi:amidohydrolase [Pseudoflavonifractor sp. HCP28S3_F10]|uniref:amidohydrolase n=1 Tax=Pseudoflavonifractor sp. HCP28S3_F10 TaxID=3438947 RepID=UPI003F8A2356
MPITAVKESVDALLQARGERYIQWGTTLQCLPEQGFCERQSTAFVMKTLEQMHLTSLEPLPISGCIGRLKGGRPGPTVAVLAELDAVYCPQHPLADSKTGMAHVCGHHMQGTMLLAAADAFSTPEIRAQLPGELVFMAVPAEEMLPQEFVNKLRAEQGIVYPSGKKELIRQSYFQGIDAVISTHAYTEGPPVPDQFYIQTSCNGFVSIQCTFRGKAAHTAECPYDGINALNAAMLCINGLQAMRETFPDGEGIRMSYILTDGGVSLSTVPEKAELSVQLRAKTHEMLDHLSDRTQEIARHAAAMVGGYAEVEASMGYEPFRGDEELAAHLEAAAEALGVPAVRSPHGVYCTDLGNVSQIVPTLHFSVSGFTGNLHSADFAVASPVSAYVLPARAVARTILNLLGGKA